MTNARPSSERLTESQLIDLATNGLAAFGVPRDAARRAAHILAIAEMMGIRTHGLARVQSYGERLAIGGIDPGALPKVEKVAPGLRRIDGCNALGPLVGMTGLDAALEAAREVGIGAAFCRGSNHFGPIAPYALMAAEEGFASFIASNATTTIAPTGGMEARLGNNPLGFGFPTPGGDPILLDMAISVVARAKIRAALKEGQAIPPDWATDRNGVPTTDPAEALKGFLQPVGGYKGYGLSLAVDALAGILSGAAYLTHVSSWVEAPENPQDLGHVFVLIDTSKLGQPDWLAGRMQDASRILRDTPAREADHPVLLPGERELAALAAARREGVALDLDVAQAMEDLFSER